jgi:hypothetical protein
MTPIRRLAAALLASALLAACGYSTGTLVSDEHRTIAVPVFENTTRRHDLEWALTRAVVEELQSRTDLRVVDLDDEPDLVLHGALVKTDEDVLASRTFQRIRESAVFVTAKIEVENARTGEKLVPMTTVTERESFTPLKGEDVRTAREEATRTLAERIVQKLEQGW